MRKSLAVFCLGLAGLMLAGCGSAPGGGSAGGGAITAPVSLTVKDTPPAGVTVLSFEIKITGAVLQPGNVSLVNSSSPVSVELTQLQTNAAFLSSMNVAVGTYSSLSLTFANPELTILNNTGAAIGSCANGAVCELKPSLSPVTVTFSSTPFPIMLTQNSPVGFQVDVNLNTIIQADLSVNLNAANGITLTQLPAASMSGELDHLDDISGTVQTVGTNQFTLKTSDGTIFIIDVDTNTQFDFEHANCVANDFTCIKAGQILSADVILLGNGGFLAKEIEFEDASGQEIVEGEIIGLSTSGGLTVMQLVVHDEEPSIANVAVGNPVSVTIQNSAAFSIDSGHFNISGGFSFQGPADLAVGQEVDVHVAGSVSVGPPISFQTDRVALEPSEVSATVALVNVGAGTFTINNLPPLFTGGSVNPSVQILVQTTSQTEFDDLTPSGLTGLATGNSVSVGGWVFSTPSGTTPLTIVAKEVRGRTISGP